MTDIPTAEERKVLVDRHIKALEDGEVAPEFALKKDVALEAPSPLPTYEDYYRRYLSGELTSEDLIRYDNDWLHALKEKDLSKKPDIIEGVGHRLRRDGLAVINSRPTTDMGNAERLVDQYSSEIRYCHQFNSWFIWNYPEGRWRKDSNGYIYRIAKDVTRRILHESSRAPLDVQVKALKTWAYSCENRQHINGMVELAQNDKIVVVSPDELDQDDFLFNVQNGTFNLKTLKLDTHKKTNKITKLADYKYDPSAKCPVFLKYLDRVFKNNPKKEEKIKYLQRCVGYTLTGSTKEQCLFLLHGSGANGKSVFINVVRALMGEYGTVTQSKTFTTDRGEISNDIAALSGCRFVCASENSSDTHLDESIIKQLTGGDEISARFLHQEYFTFKPRFKIWWSFNHAPNISDMTVSVWRRIKIVPFTEVLPESEWDRELDAKIINAELPGIFNWAIEGLGKYLESGLQEPEEIKTATKSYKNDQDILLEFFTTMTETTESELDRLKASFLYEQFTTWWNYYESSKPMSRTMFGRLCRDRNMNKIEDREGTFYTNIKIIRRA